MQEEILSLLSGNKQDWYPEDVGLILTLLSGLMIQ